MPTRSLTTDRAPQPAPRLILASASPRRQELLREAGYDFIVHPANIDEDNVPGVLLPIELAQHLAAEKARAVSAQLPDDAILAADTVVAFGDRPLGKPGNPDEARRMLSLLSGTTHIVITGVSLLCPAANVDQVRVALSAVRMRLLTPSEIDAYVASGEWQGKAGGYGIQDRDPFVTRVAGSHTNIVGLPMEITTRMLAAANIAPRTGPRGPDQPSPPQPEPSPPA